MTSEYSIHELAERANVSVRTIRFYVNEGLLPTPPTRGRYSAYTDEYVDRLELIRRLKDSFLPLKEIQATLTSLSWDEVRATLADLGRNDAAEQHEPKGLIQETRERSSSAQEYIARLLSSTAVNRPLPSRAPSIAPQESRPPSPKAVPDKAVSEKWERLSLADGLEIHIRQPMRAEDRHKIDELIKLAQGLFSPHKHE